MQFVMGCDYHQFFTKRDLYAKKLAFVDPVDNVVEDAKVNELLKTYAHEVSADYVLTCTVKSTVNVFNYFPLKYADRYAENGMIAGKRYTKSKYLKDIDDRFSRINFCSDEEYVNGFSTKFEGIWFPECCRKELICMKKAYADAKHFELMSAIAIILIFSVAYNLGKVAIEAKVRQSGYVMTEMCTATNSYYAIEKVR